MNISINLEDFIPQINFFLIEFFDGGAMLNFSVHLLKLLLEMNIIWVDFENSLFFFGIKFKIGNLLIDFLNTLIDHFI